MKRKLLLILSFLLFLRLGLNAQVMSKPQYFDGADSIYSTDPWSSSSLFVYVEPTPGNIWQVGGPDKVIFDSAATLPNAIVTDTANNYPVSNSSGFYFDYNLSFTTHAILAVQWKQKLDMQKGQDGGIVEFSADYGATWQNAFNNPYVYNFFGFDLSNKDTLPGGVYAFSGTDSTWKDIWFCLQLDWLAGMTDSLRVRYRFTSDSADTNQEGWMIDNMNVHFTMLHPVKEVVKGEYFNVYPNPANTRINIDLGAMDGLHIIEDLQLVSSEGKVLQQFKNIPTRFFLDVSQYRSGMYYLKIKSNLKSKTIPVTIQH